MAEIAKATSALRDFVDSSLLNEEQVTQLEKWYGSGWKLKYRATRDGWKADDFHRFCSGKGPTVTVIKANDCLFGGYLSISWQTKGGYANDEEASLFTLVNKFGLPPTRLPVVTAPQAAQFHPSYGPLFGCDLYIYDNAGSNAVSRSNFPSCYQDTTGSGRGAELFTGTVNFTPTEIEVFIKK